MSVATRSVPASVPGTRQEIINDFSIQVATVNGSGSQSANMVLMRSIFRMGVPVSGKNLFPSNIAGLPTWFTIRASKDGYVARRKELDIAVAMNLQTASEDAAHVLPGGVLILNADLKIDTDRTDITLYRIPFTKICTECCPEVKLRKLVVNMIYVGVLAHLLGIEMACVEESIRRQFKGKAKAVEVNTAAARAGAAYAEANLQKTHPYRVQRMSATEGKIIIDGNAAAALGAMYGGATVLAWYPITPSSSLCESAADYFEKYRVDPTTGKKTYAIIQAEDELAALGMVLGAGWAGARAMTSTSGPGISLMGEFAGLGYYAEIPAVIFDIQRVGPSTGLPTRTAQGDILQIAFLSHGDTRHPMLFPGSIEEVFEFSVDAFDIAEKLQTPIFVMSDLDLGMNNWMADPFPYPERPIARGKVMSKEEVERAGKFERYRDVDGDGIPYRTLPGTETFQASYFTRGSGHNEAAQYTERADDYKRNMDRLDKKWETARTVVPGPVFRGDRKARVGLIAFGSTHVALEESQDQLQGEKGLATEYMRLRGWPFSAEVKEFLARHDRVYVVEQNRDAQMASLLRLEAPEYTTRIRSVLHYTGIPVDARSITDAVVEQEQA